jgi:3-deoxy-D-manno-octulosonic-acid transferase
MLKAYLHPKLVTKQAHIFEIRTKVEPSKERVKKKASFCVLFCCCFGFLNAHTTIIHCITSHPPPLPIILTKRLQFTNLLAN